MRHVLVTLRKTATCDFHVAIPDDWTVPMTGKALETHGYQEVAETRDLYDWEESAQYVITEITELPPIESAMSQPVVIFGTP